MKIIVTPNGYGFQPLMPSALATSPTPCDDSWASLFEHIKRTLKASVPEGLPLANLGRNAHLTARQYAILLQRIDERSPIPARCYARLRAYERRLIRALNEKD